jgi:hypothetical protein
LSSCSRKRYLLSYWVSIRLIAKRHVLIYVWLYTARLRGATSSPQGGLRVPETPVRCLVTQGGVLSHKLACVCTLTRVEAG